MSQISSYPSLFHFGHRASLPLFSGEVIVEEKVDGSQFSFGKTSGGKLVARSKGVELNLDAPEGMFAKAVEYVKTIADKIPDGMLVRGEYLAKPKHNTLAYDRTPQNNIIVFDITVGEEQYLVPYARGIMAASLGLECVPVLWRGVLTPGSAEIELRAFFSTPSILGGQKIEGVVVKPACYSLWGPDKKLLIAKLVSEAFKEVHGGEWKKENPGSKDILEKLGTQFVTPARWNKAIQHLRDAGQLTGEMRDIGKLVKEVPADIKKEHEEEIKEALFAWAWPHISRQASKGLAEFYKHALMLEGGADATDKTSGT